MMPHIESRKNDIKIIAMYCLCYYILSADSTICCPRLSYTNNSRPLSSCVLTNRGFSGLRGVAIARHAS